MSKNSTANYGLCQWEPDDQFSRTDFNDDNLKVDSALAALSGAVDTKAEASKVEALSSTVNAKADASALAALTTKVNAKAEASAVTALTTKVNAKAEASTVSALTTKVNAKAEASTVTALTSKVNNAIGTIPKIAYGSYVGDGAAKRYISLPFAPKAVLVTDQCGGTRLHDGSITDLGGLALAGAPSTAEKTAGHNVVEISGNGFYVFNESLTGGWAELIKSNESGKTRHYLAIG